MKLFSETRSALLWILRILRQFMRIVPGRTLAVIAYLTIARVTHLLAFLLPLKIILLAASDGIPSYFRPFLSPEQRDLGIVVLSAAAIGAYALTLFLEARSKRLADDGGADLLGAAGVMAVVANQRAEMQSIYMRVAQIASATLFVAAGMMVLALLNPLLAAYILILLLCFYLLTAWGLSSATPLRRNRLADLVENRLGSYLGLLSSVAFLSGFLVVLYPFLTEAGGNVLVAIVCFILLRQTTSTMVAVTKDIAGLIQKRQLVDTLVLPDGQFQQIEGSDQKTLRELFGRQEREKPIADALGELRQPGQNLHVEWLDPPVRGTAEFSIALQGGDAAGRHFRLRVFPPRFGRTVENEDLLFRHIARDAVRAAPIVTRFTHGGHECIVYDAGSGVAPARSALSAGHGEFIATLWSVEPPPALVRVYCASHTSLHDRLTDELLARMDVAVDTDAAAQTLARLREALPRLREIMAGLPLVLHNSSFNHTQIVLDAEGAIRVLGGWGEWSLESMGVGLPAQFETVEKLDELLAHASHERPGAIHERIGGRHLIVARRCGILENEIARGAMKSGLTYAGRVLDDLDALERSPA